MRRIRGKNILGIRIRRILAFILILALISTNMEYGELLQVRANELDRVITNFRELPEDIEQQILPIGASETDICFPEKLTVTVLEEKEVEITVNEDENEETTTVSEDENEETTTVSEDENEETTTVSEDENEKTTTVSEDENEKTTTVSEDENEETTTVSEKKETVTETPPSETPDENKEESVKERTVNEVEDEKEQIEKEAYADARMGEKSKNIFSLFAPMMVYAAESTGATVSQKSTMEISVNWLLDAEESDAQTFDSSENSNGFCYVYRPELPKGYCVKENVTIPEIFVLVGAPQVMLMSEYSEGYGIYEKDGNVYQADSKGNEATPKTIIGSKKVNYLYIADDVETIGVYKFFDCGNLIEVDFSKATSLTKIDCLAFANTSLSEVDLSKATSLTSIEGSAFARCGALRTVVLPMGLETIGESAFYESDKIGYVEWRGTSETCSLKSIGKRAFVRCTNLHTFDLSKAANLETIGYEAFEDCKNLQKVDLSKATGIKILEDSLFTSCAKLKEVILPASITKISDRVFYGCESLTGVTLPSGITTMGIYVFGECDSLENVTLPADLTAIGNYVFSSCENLKKVDLSKLDKMESIESSVFANCNNLEMIVVPKGKKNILSDSVRRNCNIEIKEDGVKSIYSITADAESLDFGCINKGDNLPSEKTITITNNGNQCVEVTLPTADNYRITAGENFADEKAVLEENETATFTVVPENKQEPGNKNETLTINGSKNTSITVSLKLTVTNYTYGITATPDTIDFGRLYTGYSQQNGRTITITNTGNQQLTVDLPTAQNYEITAGKGFTEGKAVIEANGSAEFKVAPKNGLGAGNKNETLTINGISGASHNLKTTVLLQLNIIESLYTIEASTEMLDFGSVHKDASMPSGRTVTVTNTGNQQITIDLPTSSNYTISAGNGFADDKAVLDICGTATFTVEPKAKLDPGVYNETLTIRGIKGASAEIPIKLTVTDDIYSISITTETPYFPRDQGEELPAQKTITITNTGNQPIEVYLPTSKYFTITAAGGFTDNKAVIGVNDEAYLRYQPKETLAPGRYEERIIINGSYGVKEETSVIEYNYRGKLDETVYGIYEADGKIYYADSKGNIRNPKEEVEDVHIVTNLYIAENVTFIRENAFAYCYSLNTVDFSGAVCLKSIREKAFYKCSDLSKMDLSGAVNLEEIGNNAFAETKLSTLDLSKVVNLRQMGVATFSYCKNLRSVDLSGNICLTTISDSSFSSCSNLSTVKLPKTVKKIETDAFCNCYNLSEINLSEAVYLEEIGDQALASTNLSTLDLSRASKLKRIGIKTFNSCNNLQTVDLSGAVSLEKIYEYAFSSCKNLQTVDLSGAVSLATICGVAFGYDTNLQTVDLSGAVRLETIDEYIFYKGNQNVAILLPNGKKYQENLPEGLKNNAKECLYLSVNGSAQKEYDGTNFCDPKGFTFKLQGMAEGDDVKVTATDYTFDSASVGEEKEIKISDISLQGKDANKYQLAKTEISLKKAGKITKKTLTPKTITGTAAKEYDGSNSCDGTGLTIDLEGIAENDEVTAKTIYTYDNEIAGEAKTIRADRITLNGKDAVNYKLPDNENSLSVKGIGKITKKTLTPEITGTATKEYDGKKTYDGNRLSISLAGIVSGEDVKAEAKEYVYDSAAAGTEKTITATEIKLKGKDIDNYQLSAEKVVLKGCIITKKILTLPSLEGFVIKEYDGTKFCDGSDIKIYMQGIMNNDDVVATAVYTYDSADIGAGKTITATNLKLEGKDQDNYRLSSNVTSLSAKIGNIVKKDITDAKITLSQEVYTYTGLPCKPTPVVSVNIGTSEKTLQLDTDYTVFYANNVDAGIANTEDLPTVTITGNGNYTGTITQTFTINKVNYESKTVSTSAIYGRTAEYDLSLLLPTGRNLGTLTVQDSNQVLDKTPTISGTKVHYTVKQNESYVNQTATITIPVLETRNYTGFNIILTVKVTDKIVPILTVDSISKTYDNRPVSNESIRGTATVDGRKLLGSWEFAAEQRLTDVADSGWKEVIFNPQDETYEIGTALLLLTISKAKPTGKPSYTAITGAGKTLADAKLNQGNITPNGTINWDLPDTTEVKSGVSYGWTFTPNNKNYDVLTGNIILYDVSTIHEYKDNGKSRHNNNKSTNVKGNNSLATGVPSIANEVDMNGWDIIQERINEIVAMPENGIINVDINDTAIVPGSIFESIRGKNITLSIDLGNGLTWYVIGTEVTETNVPNMNMGVLKGNGFIPIDIINTITNEVYTIEIHLSHNGAFGFTAHLLVNLEPENAGKYANLYYYNPITGRAELIESTKIQQDGNADLSFNHASDYFITISDAEVVAVSTKSVKTGNSENIINNNSKNAINSNSQNTNTGNSENAINGNNQNTNTGNSENAINGNNQNTNTGNNKNNTIIWTVLMILLATGIIILLKRKNRKIDDTPIRK